MVFERIEERAIYAVPSSSTVDILILITCYLAMDIVTWILSPTDSNAGCSK